MTPRSDSTQGVAALARLLLAAVLPVALLGCGTGSDAVASAPSLRSDGSVKEEVVVSGDDAFLLVGNRSDRGLAAKVLTPEGDRISSSTPLVFGENLHFSSPTAVEVSNGWLVVALGCDKPDASCSPQPLYAFLLSSDSSEAEALGIVDPAGSYIVGLHGQIDESRVLISEGYNEVASEPSVEATYSARYFTFDLGTRKVVELAWSPRGYTYNPMIVGGPGLPESPLAPDRTSCTWRDTLWVLDSVPVEQQLSHELSTVPLDVGRDVTTNAIAVPPGEAVEGLLCGASTPVSLLTSNADRQQLRVYPVESSGALGAPVDATWSDQLVSLSRGRDTVLVATSPFDPTAVGKTPEELEAARRGDADAPLTLLAFRDRQWTELGTAAYGERVWLSERGTALLRDDAGRYEGREL